VKPFKFGFEALDRECVLEIRIRLFVHQIKSFYEYSINAKCFLRLQNINGSELEKSFQDLSKVENILISSFEMIIYDGNVRVQMMRVSNE
jgi:hypothetical protein